MALSSSIVWEVQTGGDDTNGGGFVSGAAGTDRSTQTAAQVNINNSTIVCSTPSANSNTLTFVSGYTPSSADVGNVVNISAGTNINAGVYSITAQSSTTWTLAGVSNLTTAGGAGSAVVGKMGGCLASPAKAIGFVASGNIVFVKSGSYTISSSTAGASNGRINMATACHVIGYNTTRTVMNLDSSKPTLTASGISSTTIFTGSSSSGLVRNIILDGASLTSLRGFDHSGSGSSYERCEAKNFTNTGFNTSTSSTSLIECYATGCTTQAAFIVVGRIINCVASSNTSVVGFSSGGGTIIGCIAISNGTGFSNSGGRGTVFVNCIAYANTSDGFNSDNVAIHVGCISESNGGWGYKNSAFAGLIFGATIYDCSAYNNTSGAFQNSATASSTINSITVTAGSVFVDAASGNFALNATANQGLLLKSNSTTLNVWPTGATATSSYRDVGPVGAAPFGEYRISFAEPLVAR